MEKKGSSCKVPSLGSLQAAFLSSIATLFNAHGRLVCDILQKFKEILVQSECLQANWNVSRLPDVRLRQFLPVFFSHSSPRFDISISSFSHLTQSLIPGHLNLIIQVGFFNFNAQTDRVKLWIPAGSVTRENSFWLNSNYPPDVRYQSAIVKVIIFGRIIHCLNFKKGFHKSACLISFMIW